MQARSSRPYAMSALSVERHDFENELASLQNSLVLCTDEDHFKIGFPKSFTVGFHPFVGITIMLGAARLRLDLERELFIHLCRGILETGDPQSVPEHLSKAILIHYLEPALNRFSVASQCPISIESVQFAAEKQGGTNLWVKPGDSVEPLLLVHTPSKLRYWARLVFPHGHLTAVNRLLAMLPREASPLPSRIPFTMHLFLGCTWLSPSCFEDIEPMDIVVLMQPCHRDQTKVFGYIEGWGWTIGSLNDARYILEEKMPSHSLPWQKSDPTELETLPVQLTFEIGQCTVTLGELAQLNQGSILTTLRATHLPVHILANGCSFARGELVEVGSEIGVRIRTLLMGAQERLEIPRKAEQPNSNSLKHAKNPNSELPGAKPPFQRKLGTRTATKTAMPPLPPPPRSSTQSTESAVNLSAPATALPTKARPPRINRSQPLHPPLPDQKGVANQKTTSHASRVAARSESGNQASDTSLVGPRTGYKG